MRKLAKIFMAVVAMAAVVGCTTDITEDFSVKGGGKTTLTLSLDGSRTQLGDKANEAYPLTWVEGDQVSVNGVASYALSAAEAGASGATFTFEGELATPYRLAYPAAAAGQVEFPAVQNQPVFGNIENNVTVLYGYSENGTNLTLNHLTGLLKIGIKGSANLTYAQISTIDRAPIAGAFNLDFEKGKLTATESASEVITYNFIDGALSEDEAKYIYVAVPAGTYDELYVTLTDDTYGVMYAIVKAGDSKPLTAGNVREFSSDIVYEPMSATDKFIIANYGDLMMFKQSVEAAEAILANADATDEEKAAATATLSKPAVVVADINIPISSPLVGDWSAINSPHYTGGFEGNGYAVIFDKNFIDNNEPTKPLFDTVATSIRGIHLRNVNIIEKTNPNVGALARVVDNAEAVVSHCSAEGTISVNSDGSLTADTFYTAGLVGYTTSTQTFSNLRSAVDITVAGTINGKYAVCGVVGNTGGALENATNLGTITYDASATGVIYLAGVCYDGTIFNNCNNGDGTVKAGTTTKRGSILIKSNVTTTPCISGVAGEISGMSNCHNYGDITLDSDIDSSSVYIGGVVRQVKVDNCLMVNCSNRGNISILKKVGSSGNLIVGGIMCWTVAKKAATIEDCTNYGTITLGENFEANNVGIQIGGIISKLTTTGDYSIIFTNCCNEGDFYAKKGSKTKLIAIGGLMGYATSKCWLTVDTFTNNGDMYIDCTTNTTSTNQLALGGVIGWWTNGNPSVNSKGYVINTGDINFGGTVESGRLTVGGYIGGTNLSKVFQDDIYVVCTGNITCTGTINESAANKVGGVIGTDVNAPILNAQCYCTVKAYDKTNKKSYGDCVGLLSGTARSSSVYSQNCRVGGKICRGLDADGNEIIEEVNASTALTTVYPTAITEANLTAEGLTFLSSADDILYNLQ